MTNKILFSRKRRKPVGEKRKNGEIVAKLLTLGCLLLLRMGAVELQ